MENVQLKQARAYSIYHRLEELDCEIVYTYPSVEEIEKENFIGISVWNNYFKKCKRNSRSC